MNFQGSESTIRFESCSGIEHAAIEKTRDAQAQAAGRSRFIDASGGVDDQVNLINLEDCPVDAIRILTQKA